MKTPFSIHTLLKDTLVALYPSATNWFGAKNYSSQYPSTSDSIRKLQHLYTVKGEQQFTCQYPILFNGMELQSQADKVKRVFGAPDFKRLKWYGKHQYHTWIYKLYFCGMPAQAYVNMLDKDVVAYKYRLNLGGRNAVNKLKGILKLKYHLGDVVLGDNFTIVDPYGNKLVFNNEFELTITYLSTQSHLKAAVNGVINSLDLYRMRMNQQRNTKLEFAL